MKSLGIFARMSKMYYKNYSNFSQNQKPFKIINDPKDVSKLVFEEDGRCQIFQHKNGEAQLKWIMRVSSIITVTNTLLTGAQYAYPIFGAWNHLSFGICTGLGFLMLTCLQVFSKRTVHRVHLHNLTFFNTFWIPKTVSYHISQFQQLHSSYANFLRFQLTSYGKVWIKLEKNQFRNIKDYEETLEYILMGKQLVNLATSKKKIK